MTQRLVMKPNCPIIRKKKLAYYRGNMSQSVIHRGALDERMMLNFTRQCQIDLSVSLRWISETFMIRKYCLKVNYQSTRRNLKFIESLKSTAQNTVIIKYTLLCFLDLIPGYLDYHRTSKKVINYGAYAIGNFLKKRNDNKTGILT